MSIQTWMTIGTFLTFYLVAAAFVIARGAPLGGNIYDIYANCPFCNCHEYKQKGNIRTCRNCNRKWEVIYKEADR